MVIGVNVTRWFCYSVGEAQQKLDMCKGDGEKKIARAHFFRSRAPVGQLRGHSG